MHLNIANALLSAYDSVGSWRDRIVTWTLKMRISAASDLEIKKHVRNRHYYLKQAQNSIKLKDTSQMHVFCVLAEHEQKQLDHFAKLYPGYEHV